MAAGDFTLFEEFSAEISNVHDLDADTFKCALITSATAPTAALATPNLSDFTEVTAGGNYVADGFDISATYTEAGGTGTFDGTDATWAQHASNPANARYGLIINTTQADAAVGWIDLGADIDMTAGALTITWNASGIFTLA